MTEYLPGMESEARKRDLSQFYTPPELARYIVMWALMPVYAPSGRGLRVLEPTAGRGAIVDALLQHEYVEHITAVEVDEQNVEFLRKRYAGKDRVTVVSGDFLYLSTGIAVGAAEYDLAVQNTPFEDGQTEEFILASLKMCNRVAAHVPLTTLAGQKRKRELWDNVSLTRMLVHSQRWSYGDGGGATDMVTVEVVPELQDGVRTKVEWL